MSACTCSRSLAGRVCFGDQQLQETASLYKKEGEKTLRRSFVPLLSPAPPTVSFSMPGKLSLQLHSWRDIKVDFSAISMLELVNIRQDHRERTDNLRPTDLFIVLHIFATPNFHLPTPNEPFSCYENSRCSFHHSN